MLDPQSMEFWMTIILKLSIAQTFIVLFLPKDPTDKN
jgi:hypothetical protein